MIGAPLSRHQLETRAHGGTHGERREPVGAGRGQESRALGAMIRNFEKVTEVVADLDRSEGGRPKDAAAVSADAERMRREIAERLGRLGNRAGCSRMR